MERQIYTPQFLNVYKKSGAHLPVAVWHRMVGSKLPMFSNPSDVYLPVPLTIRLADAQDVSGVKIRVSPSDSDWYSKLCSAVQSMLDTRAPIEIQTHLGQPIAQMTHAELLKAGELKAVNKTTSATLTRVDRQIVAPPKHMAADKIRDIEQLHADEWRSGVVDVVMTELAGKSMPEVDAAMMRDGPVQKAIATYIRSSVADWNGLLETYARDETAKRVNAANGGQDAAMAIARGYLQQIRSGMRANAPHIKTYFARAEAEAVAGSTVDAPLFAHEHVATGATRFSDARSMWREIAEDAMYHGASVRIPVAAIYDGHTRVCSAPKGAEQVGARVAASFRADQTHPLKRANVDSALADQHYPGDPERALDMFHFYAGIGAPSGRKSRRGKGKHMPENTPSTAGLGAKLPELVPLSSLIGPSMEDIKKKRQQEKERYEEELHGTASITEPRRPYSVVKGKLPDLIPLSQLIGDDASENDDDNAPVECKLPDLIPLSQLIGCKECGGHEDDDDKDELKSSIKSKLPELVPLSELVGDHYPGHRHKGKDKKPHVDAKLPVKGKLPELVPLSELVGECHHKGKDKKHMKSKLPEFTPAVQGKLPELVPLEQLIGQKRYTPARDPLDVYDLDAPIFASGYDDAPSMADFL